MTDGRALTQPQIRRHAIIYTKILALETLEKIQLVDYISVHKEHSKIRRKYSFLFNQQTINGKYAAGQNKTSLSFVVSAISSINLHDHSLVLLTS